MSSQKFSFEFEEYNSIDELQPADAILLQQARKVTQQAYAPYSNFHVGAVAQLNNGETVIGTNQENASYPVGICAERVLLSTLSSLHPNMPIQTLAISYHNHNGDSNTPVSPCGICRQSLLEYESRSKQHIRLILSGMEGKVWIIEKASMLLPLSFTSDDLK
jgi:cytidine deaminase